MIAAVFVLAVPLAEIDAGVIVHVASDGSPAQVSAIVPLNPLELVTLTDVVPEPPGLAITTVDWADGMEVKNPAAIVKVCDCVVLLELKLGSPAYKAEIVCVPVSNETTPFGVAVLPSLFKAKLPPPGIGPKLSLNVTFPVGTPCPDWPATSARR